MRGKTFLRNLGAAPSERHRNLLNLFSDSGICALLKEDVWKKVALEQHPLTAVYQDLPAGEDVWRAQYADVLTYMVDDILMKVDKMSMAHSLEVRVPILDHKVVEFAFSLPLYQKIKGQRRKIALKDCVADLIPTSFFERKKQGFSVPLKNWLLGELHDYVEEYMLIPSGFVADYFDRQEIIRLWSLLKKGGGWIDPSSHIWSLLCFELWGRTFFSHGDGQRFYSFNIFYGRD
jgi:asparagine synthase (glutamine-hydrolysing)